VAENVPVPALLAARKRERARLAAILHDDIAGGLTAAGLSLDLLTLDAPPELAERIREIQDLLERSFESVRELTIEFHPDPAVRFRLVPALEKLAARTRKAFAGRLTADLSDEVAERLTDEQSRVCFLVAEEALRNAMDHSRAAHVRLALEPGSERGVFQLIVEDDGMGCDAGTLTGGTGYAIVRNCARDSGFALTVRSELGKGVTVSLMGRWGSS